MKRSTVFFGAMAFGLLISQAVYADDVKVAPKPSPTEKLDRKDGSKPLLVPDFSKVNQGAAADSSKPAVKAEFVCRTSDGRLLHSDDPGYNGCNMEKNTRNPHAPINSDPAMGGGPTGVPDMSVQFGH
jgi:hypothetical protein